MKAPLTLALEGSTYVGSVALLRDGEVIAEKTLPGDEGGAPATGRGERLVPAVAECIAAAAVNGRDVTRIICGAGPGRFTSLRIAGSAAKGLATGFGAKLYGVSSLLLTVAGARPKLEPGEYLSVLDAMRGDWFVARVTISADGGVSENGAARMVSSAELDTIARTDPRLRLIGPGQPIDAHPHARGVALLLSRIIAGGPVDLASWEPDYGRLPEAQVRREAASRAAPAR
ncbi:MAG TPA: tRNA (adenosine(37)-N6)-threonylcarbamoyltransferase complex dimerization subunit type 1 TsaB [Gemmatimonadaceae bacterium]|nr:tRNA (adenosine(37)-N6)-threonylcarbamoyltransferase complex dimerization subunit type 1 TsaB [Gemmatimonadaceae bacterium]